MNSSKKIDRFDRTFEIYDKKITDRSRKRQYRTVDLYTYVNEGSNKNPSSTPYLERKLRKRNITNQQE